MSIFFLISLVSLPAFAQDKVKKKTAFVSVVTKNWEEAKAGKNLVARYRLKSSKLIQVDVRSAPVPKGSEKQYFTTFHNSLIKSGMKKSKTSESDLLKGQKVKVVEYEMKRKSELYNVLVFESHSNDTAWLLLVVTPEKKRSVLDKNLPELFKGFVFP